MEHKGNPGQNGNQNKKPDDGTGAVGKVLGWVFGIGFIAMLLSGIGFWLWEAVPQFTDFFKGGFLRKLIDHEHNLGGFLLVFLLLLVEFVPCLFGLRVLRKAGWPKTHPRAAGGWFALSMVMALPIFLLVFYWLYGLWYGPLTGGSPGSIVVIGGLGFYGGTVFNAILRVLGTLVFSLLIAGIPNWAAFAYEDHKQHTQ